VRLVLLRSIAVLAAGAGVLIAVLYVASTVDARSPEVVAFALTQPLPDDADTALITTSLEVTFNEPVRVDAGAEPLTIEPEVAGTYSWSGSTLTFTPSQPLALQTEYVATVGTGIRDLAGNRIGSPVRAFAFETAGRPEVVETVPTDGADTVAVDGPITIRFSTLMDTASVERALRITPNLPHELAWSGETVDVVPSGPLEPGTEYTLSLAKTAADVAGVTIGGEVVIRFHTVAGGFEPTALVPADGIDGVAPATAVALVFERPIDPESVSDVTLTIEPAVAGSLEVVTARGETLAGPDDTAGTVLRFQPSGRLPLNTTFEVSLEPGLRAVDGAVLAQPIRWSFTTGAPSATLSNQVTFISDLGGVANVWAMNPDGSGLRQVSTELAPVLDYAVSPDGSRLVVADGRRLVSSRADGSGRSVLTAEEHVEFDPAFAPNGERLVFARADAETGEGLGLWLATHPDSAATQLDLEPDDSASEGGTSADLTATWLRAPRFSPDGRALAFVAEGGALGVVELATGDLALADAAAVGTPHWIADSSAVLVTRGASPVEPPADASAHVAPLRPAPDPTSAVVRVDRSGAVAEESNLRGAAVAVATDGRVACIDDEGVLWLGSVDGSGRMVRATTDAVRIRDAAFGPGASGMVIELDGGRIEVLDTATGERRALGPNGTAPRWLP
jgi:hypothetical protein